VPRPGDIRRAVETARAVPGVRSVVARLRAGPSADPAELTVPRPTPATGR
jgi:hypothetical protein